MQPEHHHFHSRQRQSQSPQSSRDPPMHLCNLTLYRKSLHPKPKPKPLHAPAAYAAHSQAWALDPQQLQCLKDARRDLTCQDDRRAVDRVCSSAWESPQSVGACAA